MISMQDCGFSPLEKDFADLMVRLAPEGGNALRWAAALAMNAVEQNHICCDLAQQIRPREVPENYLQILQESSAVISAGGTTPLVLDQTRIYLQKMYRKEVRLAETLRHFARPREDFDPVRAGTILQKLFPDAPESDLQMQAVRMAAKNHLTILSGGPGTGKTYTAGKILAFLREWYGNDLQIAGAAPTGKAAVRLGESLTGITTSTIHRLLGIVPCSPMPHYRRERKLPYDVVILDEVSMVPLTLMEDFFAAMPDDGTVILLGDQDQLSSVEPGAVFADLCAAFRNVPEKGDSFVGSLTESRRFPAEGSVAKLSQAIHAVNTLQDAKSAVDLFQAFPEEIEWIDMQDRPQECRKLCQRIREGYTPLRQAETPEEALDALDRFRILTAVHRGSYGRNALNALSEEVLRIPRSDRQKIYRGHPIMIRKNVPQLQLFNGDTGVLWQSPGTANWEACFRDEANGIRRIPLELLPEYESAYAITVHRAQGSEFDRILLALPPDDFYSRELIYTGLTRTRSTVITTGSPDHLQKAILRKARRSSGLQDRLQSGT